jgi:AbrB family looped-hinge helix DNA binding protein
MAASVRITEGGRIVIPAEFRRALGLNVGDELLLRLEDGELRLFTLEQGIKRAQETYRRYVPADRDLVDELIKERHAEAERE